MIPHGETPSADASGRGFAQATACPGTHLRAALAGPDGSAAGVDDLETVRRAVQAAQGRLAEAAALLEALRAPSRL